MRRRLAMILTVGAATASLIPGPPALGASPDCHVRNVTQGTAGASFVAMVGAARTGDTVHVRGLCEGGVKITTDLTVIGIGDPRPKLTGRDQHGILWIERGAEVTLRHLDLAHGRKVRADLSMALPGGAIWNLGRLRVVDSVIRDSEASGDGGGIWSGGAVSLEDSSVLRNVAKAGGGIALDSDGSLVLLRSVLRSNWGMDQGGGIRVSGTLIMDRSVVRDGRALDGGGIWSEGTVSVTASTIHGNVAENGGGGISNIEGSLALARSRVSDNHAGEGGGIQNQIGDLTLDATVVRDNRAGDGGGIWNGGSDFQDTPGMVTVSADSSVTGNTPDDCVGTPAC